LKVFITGSTGFIGSRLALKCHELGHDIVALGQLNTPIEEFRTKDLREKGVEIQSIPLDAKEGLAAALTDCDVVYHLAAAQHEANVPDEYFRQVNVEGTRNMLDASVEAGVKRFVHGSTIGIYGSALDGKIDEDSPARPDNIYGVTKLEAEKLVLEHLGHLPVTVIRISETYGPGDGRLLKLFKAISKGTFFVIGNGQNLHQLIYVDDLVTALMTASENEAVVGEVVVVAGTERLSTNDMCHHVAAAVDEVPPQIHAPMWPFMTVAFIMEKTLGPLGIQPPLHRRRLDFFRKSFFFDQDKAEKTLRFRPATTFSEGTKLTAVWYVENGFI
jgi:nucleoside-diphosphate-sugar epimerase